MTVRTRFAPSPTGFLHIGGVRTALFSWLYARHHDGEFVLRIEDTDRERSTSEAMDMILDGMEWLGLNYDKGPFHQSKRGERYSEVIDQLLREEKAYHCYCSKEELEKMRADAMARGDKPKYNGRCRTVTTPPPDNIKPVVRFKNPLTGQVVVNDMIQGKVTYRNDELDDLIIARSDGTPTYNLTVVVDDMDMEITHVIRGDDHLNNTPRQMNLFSALDRSFPEYAHAPLILGENGKKLSKRQEITSILDYKDKGYLPEAILNYLVRLGWSHGDQEIFSADEMIELFDVASVNKSAASINPDKLIWLNQHYIKTGDSKRLSGLLGDYLRFHAINTDVGPSLEQIVVTQKDRVKTLSDMALQSRYFFEDFDTFDETAARKHLQSDVLEPFSLLQTSFQTMSDWSAPAIYKVIEEVAVICGIKLGKIAQPLRVAVTGNAISPSIDTTLSLIGQKRVIERVERAIDHIRKLPMA